MLSTHTRRPPQTTPPLPSPPPNTNTNNINTTQQILGGNGYTNDYPAGRLLRDAKLYEIGAGTSEIRRLLIGRELLKDELAAR